MRRPNIVVILADDMGYSDIGCYGGEIETPNLDRLARNGLRYSQFYNTARCSPSRASLLTGLHPHQTGIGVLTYPTGPEGYSGDLSRASVTIPEVLKTAGYRSYMSGKWHVSASLTEPSASWPMQRGFDGFFGTTTGCGSFFDPNTLMRGNEPCTDPLTDPDFFYTDAINDEAARFVREHEAGHPDAPLFLYVAHTAPHFPLHAHEEDIARCRGRFDAGWDALREARFARLRAEGLIDSTWPLSPRDPEVPSFAEAPHREWQLRRMEVYAAQVERMDRGIGRLLEALEETGRLADTLLVFLSDNGGCAESVPVGADLRQFVEVLHIARSETRDGRPVRLGNDPAIPPGGEETYQSYGVGWSNLSNTPFRMHKRWIHEGGISTPFIVHWPNGIAARNAVRHTPGQLPDLMATLVDLTGAKYPERFAETDIPPCEGSSLVPSFSGDVERTAPLFWEHIGNAGMRDGRFKLVRDYPGPWELYDIVADRTELHDLAAAQPERVKAMAARYEDWAERCGVIPFDRIQLVRFTAGKPAG